MLDLGAPVPSRSDGIKRMTANVMDAGGKVVLMNKGVGAMTTIVFPYLAD